MKKIGTILILLTVFTSAYANDNDTSSYKKNEILVMPVYVKTKTNNSIKKDYFILSSYQRLLKRAIKFGINTSVYLRLNDSYKYNFSSQSSLYALSSTIDYNFLNKKKKNELWAGVAIMAIKELYKSKTDGQEYAYQIDAKLAYGINIQYFYNIYKRVGIGVYGTFYWGVSEFYNPLLDPTVLSFALKMKY